MAVKVKVAHPKKAKGVRAFVASPLARALVAAFLIVCLIAFGIFAFYYVRYQKIVDERIRKPIFNNAAKIYATPEIIDSGDKWTVDEIASTLRRAGYTEGSEKGASPIGTYTVSTDTIQIRPGAQSYHSSDPATIRVSKGKVEKISGGNGSSLDSYELEPQLVTGLFDSETRSKRRIISYDETPKVLVDAILSAEDRRFFEHSGVNYYRLAEAVLIDLRGGHKQGGSTLTMQVARGFFLNQERNGWAGIKRKGREILIALELEQRFSKKQIFELYLNGMDLGQRGSFDIKGFAEASYAYFGKDVNSLTLPQAAMLAGLVNNPIYFSPFRHPDRALTRRNIVLNMMADNGVITKQQAEEAKATPLNLAPPNVDASEAPYYIDLVREALLARYKDSDLNEGGMRIYTSLDPQLQRAAAEAIEIGMKQVDAIVTRRRTRKIKHGKGKSATTETQVESGPMPQVALIALDPHTGQVLALSGGRNYGQSQLDHAIAKRPTGSIFKPFVYAAAINTALTGDPSQAFTQATPLDATEHCFDSDQGPYCPRNFDPKYSVPNLSARTSLAHSVNTATIELAKMVGYDKVVQLARAAGIKSVRATPAMAIGSYDATPLEMAGAYTVFANSGTRISPMFIKSVRAANGDVVEDFAPEKTSILDPRVAFVLTDMMEAVMNNGTAAGVRGQGFSAPAAGKTGTSHDAWFAGYTSNLLCIVWVGNDDYSDIKMEGAHAAAPIWAEFMKRAIEMQRYKDVKPFNPPAGVTQVKIDKVTNLLATPACPDDYDAYFIDGTAPIANCEHSMPDNRNFLQKLFGVGSPGTATPTSSTPSNGTQTRPLPSNQRPLPNNNQPAQPQQQEQSQPKKEGFWHRIFGGGGGDKKDQQPQSNPR